METNNRFRRSSSRRIAFAVIALLFAASTTSSVAQYVNRGVARWAVADQVYGGRWYGPVQYGATGYSYYQSGVQTAYGNAVRAKAALTMAQSNARRNDAVAAEYNEKARSQYLDNKAKYDDIRRQQRAAIEKRKTAEQSAQKERAANRQQKAPTDLYPRLSLDQLDRTTGTIDWPMPLLSDKFQDDRATIEAAVQSIAQNGPDQRSAGIISNIAKRMKTNTSDLIKEVGFEAYSDARKFLGSLSVEGYYALEEK